jgi:hypothetical protein
MVFADFSCNLSSSNIVNTLFWFTGGLPLQICNGIIFPQFNFLNMAKGLSVVKDLGQRNFDRLCGKTLDCGQGPGDQKISEKKWVCLKARSET